MCLKQLFSRFYFFQREFLLNSHNLWKILVFSFKSANSTTKGLWKYTCLHIWWIFVSFVEVYTKSITNLNEKVRSNSIDNGCGGYVVKNRLRVLKNRSECLRFDQNIYELIRLSKNRCRVVLKHRCRVQEYRYPRIALMIINLFGFYHVMLILWNIILVITILMIVFC